MPERSALAASPSCGLHHTTLQLPVNELHKHCPALFVTNDTVTRLHRASFKWAVASLGIYSDAEIGRRLRVVGRLHDFWVEVWGAQPLSDADQSTLIWSYLSVRYHGSADSLWDDSVRRLAWRPVAYTSVRSELATIAAYFRFLRLPQSTETVPVSENLVTRLESQTKLQRRGFFQHLAAQRERWRETFGLETKMPSIRVSGLAPGSDGPGLDRTPDWDEIKSIIANERNPMWRAIWILLAYGGPRISEVLHMWQCDVLPASAAATMFDWPTDDIACLLAHPAESQFTGELTKRGPTRKQFLDQRYGLKPRTECLGKKRVGWKGIQFRNERQMLAPIYWLPGGAVEFGKAIEEVRHFHMVNETSKDHPWLFVNIQRGEGFGEPIQSSGVRKAFARNCQRLNLEPGRNGRRIHGHRHLYKAELNRLGLNPSQIQIMMRHRSLFSQDDYGHDAAETQRFLNSATTDRTI